MVGICEKRYMGGKRQLLTLNQKSSEKGNGLTVYIPHGLAANDISILIVVHPLNVI